MLCCKLQWFRLFFQRLCVQCLKSALFPYIALALQAILQEFTMSYLGVARFEGGRVIARSLPELQMVNADAE